MTDSFKQTAKRVSTVQSTLKVWKKAVNGGKKDEMDSNQLFPGHGDRRKSLMDSFKDVVNKVKVKTTVKVQSSYEMEVWEKEKTRYMQSIFNLPEKERRVTIYQADTYHREEDQEEKIGISEVQFMKTKDVANFISNELVGDLLHSKIFRYSILSCIITNTLLIAVETDRTLERKYKNIFKILDEFMTSIFLCEILLKWYHNFVSFWKYGWNILDFTVIAALLLGPYIQQGSSGRGIFRILRVLRAFRSLRSIRSLPGLQIVVQAILQSVPDMANIVLLLVIIMSVFSVIGITVFRETIPDSFGSMSSSMFTLFICLTQDGWVDIFKKFKAQGEDYYYGGAAYFIAFIFLGAFIFCNLIIAVVVTNLECAVKDVKEEEELQAKELEMKGKLEKESNDQEEEVTVLKGEDIPDNVFRAQTALVTRDLSGMNMNNIENYFIVIAAMEENFKQYKAIKTEINEIFNELIVLNQENAFLNTEESEQPEAPTLTVDSASVSDLNKRNQSIHKMMQGGDIVSNMIDLEAHDHITTMHSQSISEVLRDSASAVMGTGSRRSSLVNPRRNSVVQNNRRRSSVANRRSSLVQNATAIASSRRKSSLAQYRRSSVVPMNPPSLPSRRASVTNRRRSSVVPEVALNDPSRRQSSTTSTTVSGRRLSTVAGPALQRPRMSDISM